MAGKFTFSKYEKDDGTILNIKLQPETLTSVNVAPSGAVEAGWPSAQVAKGRRSIGIHARYISCKWTGAVPDGYDADGVLRVTILTKSVYDGLALGSTFTYLGQPTRIIGLTGEKIR